ncbi:DUF3575 domain-containing protein [Pedobacter frigidisoli]|uniref:DUF3575 domain-containing protein n=1 Tax=Pedobacter frigidisoli TaxID=2530455 RepID=A0A4R0NNL5_9SPHI|nr:DUF3575 domain-containing protein [Pedobacter frigidisoli]TCD02316.1 DUF3575 domain-containing protein [Pedobacter frigidisoli]
MNLNFTKTLALTLVIGLFYSSNSFAQTTQTAALDRGKNLVKLNFGSFLFKSVNIQYERAIHKKMTVGVGVRLMPKSSIPFSSSFDSADEQIGSLKLSNFAITPEVKWYFGKDVFKGFYVAPFLRLANYSAKLIMNLL